MAAAGPSHPAGQPRFDVVQTFPVTLARPDADEAAEKVFPSEEDQPDPSKNSAEIATAGCCQPRVRNQGKVSSGCRLTAKAGTPR
jgi:hypothetical protein